MRKVIVIAFGFSLAAVAIADQDPHTAESQSRGTRLPVIVELFTSEGCSSCPAADTLLSTLEELQPIEGAEVIALEEHVDYWNSLGWTDPFSSSEFTSRQEGYARALGRGSVYTPQMVVDGNQELVGSRGREVRTAIAEAARQRKMEVKLEQNSTLKEDPLQFSVTIGELIPEPQDAKVDIWVAVTERRLHSDVKRGENAGQDLRHASVVRCLRRIGTMDSSKEKTFSRAATLPLQRSWQRENLLLVTFAQEQKTRRIVGARSAKIL